MARKILLADDSVTAQNMGRKILADAGYEVIAVNNGSAALKKIAELKPDLVILDVYMPGYSGLEVCQRLKESQETARIPVMLTVGKLEPFKPEEAQRVRAEGFIVKPFEASELLSALSKLEDKVVPRAEPSKPGRFARAIAAAEESGRGSRTETASGDTGWKSRIGFPHKKTEVEEKATEEPSTYNPVNRDLRTVVETAAEKIAEKVVEAGEKPHQEARVAESVVDVAALAPAGLPKDVTPEEVAAIAAAAAQIQMASAVIQDDYTVPQANGPLSQERALEKVEDIPPRPSEAQESGGLPPHQTEERKMDVPAPSAATDADHGRSGDEAREESQDVPVTMAATAESVTPAYAGSRWTAVPVTLEGDEASISLEQEMQKAYAALVAAESPSAPAATAPQAENAPAESSSTLAASNEAPTAAISSPEPDPVSKSETAAEPVMPAAVSSPVTADLTTLAPDSAVTNVTASDFAANRPAMASDAGASDAQFVAAVPMPVAAEIPAKEATANTPPQAEFAEPNQPRGPDHQDVIASPAPPVADHAIRAASEVKEEAKEEAQELQTAPQAELAVAEAAAAGNAGAPIVHDVEPVAESKLDPETVKSTAAAWASWRQIRDTSKNETAQTQPNEAPPKEFEVPGPAPVGNAARAVAAGAEQPLQEASTATPSEGPADVASIVDSVLADLRPKLMEEISRKMAKQK